MSLSLDTITALATPSGRGGIAVIRISGPHAKSIGQEIVRAQLAARQAAYLPFYDADGGVIDKGIAIFFPNPHSFTGEDVIELQGHGGPVVVDLLLQEILAKGARLARPGEFSERAFLNNKIDLAQAEAIADLISATSKQAAKSAMRSLQGEFSKEVHQLNEKIIHLRMYIEAAIDFTDEEIDFLNDEKIKTDFNRVLSDLKIIQEKAKQGSFLREGITAVIVGEPNVGKSSLLNALSGKETAIVTDIPGTTRDVLRDYILIDGMPMHIIDTAGLRDSTDIVEQEGIRRAYKEMEQADLILCVSDASKTQTELPPTLAFKQAVIYIRNKIDLINEEPALLVKENKTVISLSAKASEGLDLLKNHIKAQIGFQSEAEGIFLARRRHLDALSRAKAYLDAGWIQLTTENAPELVAEDLRLAHLALAEITGEFTTDDLLGRIFSSFCIGK